MAAPWRDALKHGAATPAVARPAAPVPAIDLAAVSPALAGLIREREALQSSIDAITGKAAADPRFVVAPLAERRAEIQRWADGRDARRANAPTPEIPKPPTEPARVPPRREVPPPERSFAGRMLGGLDPRTVPLSPPPALRPTPGETPGGGGTPGSADAFVLARNSARDRAALLRPATRPESEPERPRRRAAPEPARPQGSKSPDEAEMLERAFERWDTLRDKPRQAQQMLQRARRAIPDEWAERAKRAVPALGKADPYLRRADKLLGVAVGSVDEFGQQSDKLRSLARDVRELREADEAKDEARRDRAIERLKAKRQEA